MKQENLLVANQSRVLSKLLEVMQQIPPVYSAYVEAMRHVTLTAEELTPYSLFHKSWYTRNLIFRNEHFELLTLCWEPGQLTPIHDHAQSGGWFYGIAGHMEEKQYRLHTGAVAPLVYERTIPVGAGFLTSINDSSYLHSVSNAGDHRAITLHFYTPPMQVCRYFNPATGKSTQQQMSYYSVNGIPISN